LRSQRPQATSYQLVVFTDEAAIARAKAPNATKGGQNGRPQKNEGKQKPNASTGL
jgi:hypothetical protein